MLPPRPHAAPVLPWTDPGDPLIFGKLRTRTLRVRTPRARSHASRSFVRTPRARSFARRALVRSHASRLFAFACSSHALRLHSSCSRSHHRAPACFVSAPRMLRQSARCARPCQRPARRARPRRRPQSLTFMCSLTPTPHEMAYIIPSSTKYPCSTKYLACTTPKDRTTGPSPSSNGQAV